MVGRMSLPKMARKLRRALRHDEPGHYDMFENRGEQFSARPYLHQMMPPDARLRFWTPAVRPGGFPSRWPTPGTR